MKKIMTRYAPVAALFACCCLPLTACGTEHPGTQAAATAGQGSSATDETGDDGQGNLPDTTSDDQGTLPDTTSDDQGTLPDTTSDDQGTLPDTTSDDQGTLPDTTSDDQGTLPDTTSDDQGSLPDTTTDDGSTPTGGPNRWFPMLREFRAYLATSVPKADAALAAHVTSVRIRVPAGSARSEAVVRVDFGVGEQDEADRTAVVFAHWRSSVYGDHGHVDVLGPAKTTAEKDW
ncbi:hypothetical protein [Streptomyces scabiei]|uniref:hypothetical protein n=1 Tax=Streptomyces scabiei TaxID=1930 RepID=UPI0029A92F24|nr:hypothetical protein [Streptomyces scabiei]MDX3113440.1 hypothetical protein [Streptomyces scabiei]